VAATLSGKDETAIRCLLRRLIALVTLAPRDTRCTGTTGGSDVDLVRKTYGRLCIHRSVTRRCRAREWRAIFCAGLQAGDVSHSLPAGVRLQMWTSRLLLRPRLSAARRY
jgi:hypothetical protein